MVISSILDVLSLRYQLDIQAEVSVRSYPGSGFGRKIWAGHVHIADDRWHVYDV